MEVVSRTILKNTVWGTNDWDIVSDSVRDYNEKFHDEDLQKIFEMLGDRARKGSIDLPFIIELERLFLRHEFLGEKKNFIISLFSVLGTTVKQYYDQLMTIVIVDKKKEDGIKAQDTWSLYLRLANEAGKALKGTL